MPYSCRGDGDAKDDASASSRDGSYVTEWTDLDVPSEPEHESERKQGLKLVNNIVGDVDLDVPPEPEHEPEHVSERTFENAFAGVDVLGDRYK